MGERSSLLDGFGDDFAWSLFDSAPDAIVVVAESGDVAFANDQAAALFRSDLDHLVGSSVDDLIPMRARSRHREHRESYREHPGVRSMGVGLQLQARRADGTEFDCDISLSPLVLDGHQFVVAAVRDIGERVAAEAARLAAESELRERDAELHRAQQAVLLAEDHERLARDLHDTVIQRLFAAGLSLQAAAAMSGDDRIRSRLETTVEDLDDTIRELRNAIFALQSPVPALAGVRGRILEVVTDASTASGIEPRIQFEGPVESIDEQIVEHLLPTLREALSNVAKHARATAVRVSVRVGEEVAIEVVDDGVGVAGEVFGGNGVANMARRAEQLGGQAHLTPDPSGTGTRLTWAVPAEVG